MFSLLEACHGLRAGGTNGFVPRQARNLATSSSHLRFKKNVATDNSFLLVKNPQVCAIDEMLSCKSVDGIKEIKYRSFLKHRIAGHLGKILKCCAFSSVPEGAWKDRRAGLRSEAAGSPVRAGNGARPHTPGRSLLVSLELMWSWTVGKHLFQEGLRLGCNG